MSRTRAEALVLVNWKGVFYQRYLLDRHVTALEGANGSGKTSVMIAAYVVLLPDMSRLRFTNLGETGATGGDKGIWGRLGEPGRPSYAVIDFVIGGPRRLIAGVHLERKGEPSVEPMPFIVTGLDASARLQDLMLVVQGDSEVVPELNELRENAARLGGRLQVFASAREYFAALFEQGVTPLRLGTDEERAKLNEMLRTSMTGGISRALTSELRDFLLKEESGLSNTLQRMQANLDACRRTRTEVQESRRLEREIHGVFEAGQAMFVAAFHATRERADDLMRRVAEAEGARATARDALAGAESLLQDVIVDQARAEAEYAAVTQDLATARGWLARVREAVAAADVVSRCRVENDAATTQAAITAEQRELATDARDRRRAQLRGRQEDHRRAADGLANLQNGLEELHRRAAAYHQVTRRSADARRLLGVTDLPPGTLAAHESQCRVQLGDVDRARRELSVRLADVKDHRRMHRLVLEAVGTLRQEIVPAEDAYAAAVEALVEHRERVALADRAPAIAKELDSARRAAARQAKARAQAEALGVTLGDGPASAHLQAMLEATEREQRGLEDAQRMALSATGELERRAREAGVRIDTLAEQEPEWRDLDGRAHALGAAIGKPVHDRPTLESARSCVADALLAAGRQVDELRRRSEGLHAEARELLAAGGPFETDLLRVKDRLGADLLAASFEDEGLEEAARLEARLGPLVQALVVEDPRAAARMLVDQPSTMPSVWLVARDATLTDLVPTGGEEDGTAAAIAVAEGPVLRVSRIPVRPRLGRRAREKRAADLRGEAEALERELEDERSRHRTLERLRDDGEALLAGHVVWLAGDPGPEMAELRRQVGEVVGQAAVHRGEAARHGDAGRALRPRVEALRRLFGESLLLDPPDHGARATQLHEEHGAALSAQGEVARCTVAAKVVDESIGVLRRLPLSDHDVDELQREAESLRGERDRLEAAIEALDHVIAHVEALEWSEAPIRLANEQALVPALQRQLDEAVAAMEAAEESARVADGAYDDATSAWHDADARLKTAAQQLSAAEDSLHELGVIDPTQSMVQIAAEDLARVEERSRDLDRRRSDLATERGRREAAREQASTRHEEAGTKLISEQREAEPAVERWERLRARATQHALLSSAVATGLSDGGVRGQVNLMQEAQKQRVALTERLRAARDGSTLLAEIEPRGKTADGEFADTHLELWLAVRDWLRRRLPAQVAEVDDPREALMRLRDQLSSLEERLARQEGDLRGASEDVARGIDVQVRKARGQVTRLNKNLEGISFGSIAATRVRLQPVEKMEQVLRALREGAAQALLFQENLPLEEALEEIFRRHGGGKAGGRRLLDYREYVHLQVEVRRKAGTDWEVANPTRLSTGEAIGVGAALMMVVLTEWERDANLLRAKKTHGSLRFLFLDEANRLDHENLGVLFDLCQTLDLQLLIAAPEVAQAEGNTTYRLVRRTTSDNREEVLVSGRRTRPEA